MAKFSVNNTEINTADFPAHELKAYQLPANIVCKNEDGTEVDVSMFMHEVTADQGSDINLITQGMVDQFGIQVHNLRQDGLTTVTMNTADGNEIPLRAWCRFRISVEGIEREVQAFVADGTHETVHALLGLPWLYDVAALFDIRQSTLTIGDPAHDGERIVMEGPLFMWGPSHKLVLEIKPQPTPKPKKSKMKEVKFAPEAKNIPDEDRFEGLSDSSRSNGADSESSHSGTDGDTETIEDESFEDDSETDAASLTDSNSEN